MNFYLKFLKNYVIVLVLVLLQYVKVTGTRVTSLFLVPDLHVVLGYFNVFGIPYTKCIELILSAHTSMTEL